MATIGQPLLQPESGWVRYNNTDSFFTYTGSWGQGTPHRWSNGVGASVKFSFFGSGIRIIAPYNTNGDTSTKITIDGTEYFFNQNGALVYGVLSFEKNDLETKLHEVELRKTNSATGAYIYFDAVDTFFQKHKFTLKNNDKNYSMSDKTLIQLPSSSSKNMILHGIEQGKEIQLDVPFTKMGYIEDPHSVNDNVKIFKRQIDVTKIKSIGVEHR